MDARSNNSAIDISISIEDITCPVTQELFFEPVLAMPCGHAFEEKANGGLVKDACPTCRKEILMFGPALATKRELDKALQANPELYSKVYFNLDHFADIVSKKNFKHPVAERFIKLLENAPNHVNDKAVDGAHKNKNAIQVLCASFEGREYLRSNEKIQATISDKTRELEANGKTIAEWLAMEKEEKPAAREQKKVKRRHQPSQQGIFANNAARPARQAEDNVWQRVVYGNEAGVLEPLRQNANLVTEKRTVIDYSDREVDDATPFQMALRAGDEVMANKIKDLYLRANPANGQQVLDTQFNEIFPEGYAAHLRAQQQAVDEFERDYLNPLIEVITNASRQDLDAALAKQYNDSELHQRLAEFKSAFDALSKNEKVYNPNHLLKAFKKYNENFDQWHNKFNDNHWRHLDLFWRQVIGWQERYMTTNYAQSFCTGLANMVNHNQPLQRTLRLHNYENNGRDINFFPLDSDDSYKLGTDFGAYSFAPGHACPRVLSDVSGERDWCFTVVLTKLMSTKQQTWANYAASAESSRNARLPNNVTQHPSSRALR